MKYTRAMKSAAAFPKNFFGSEWNGEGLRMMDGLNYYSSDTSGWVRPKNQL